MSNTEKLVKATIEGIQEKKGHNITVIDLKEIDDTITQFLVICEGNSPTQVAAITDSVRGAHLLARSPRILRHRQSLGRCQPQNHPRH